MHGLARTFAAVAILLFACCIAHVARAADAAANAPAASEDPEKAALRLVGERRDADRLAEARTLAEQGLASAEKKYGPSDPRVAKWLSELGRTMAAQGLYADAEPIFERALSINERSYGVNAAETCESLGDLGMAYVYDDRLANAEPLLKRALAIAEKIFTPERHEISDSLSNLAALYAAQGRLNEAEPLYARALAIDEKRAGPDHRDTAESLSNLALLYYQQGRLAEAEPLLKRAIAIDEKTSPENRTIAIDLNSLALVYQEEQRYAEAEQLFRRSLAICEKKLGDHPDTSTELSNLANLFIDQGRLSEGEPLFLRAIAISEKANGVDSSETVASVNNLAKLYELQGRVAEASKLLERCVSSLEKTLGPDHLLTARAMSNLADAQRVLGNFARAEQLIRRTLAIFNKVLPPDAAERIGTIANLAELYLDWGRPADAAPLFDDVLTRLAKSPVPDRAWIASMNYSQSLCLLALGRTADAYAAARRAAKLTAAEEAEGIIQQLRGGWHSELTHDDVFMQVVRTAYALSRANPESETTLRLESFEAIQRIGFDDTGRALANTAARLAAGTDALGQLLREQRDLLRRQRALDRQLSNAMGSSDPTARAQTVALSKESEATSMRLSAIDATLRRDHKAYSDMADPKPVGLAETQSLLRTGEAILMIAPAHEALFLMAVSDFRIAWARVPVANKELTAAVSALLRQLNPDTWQVHPLQPFDRALAHRLYRVLWAPLDDVLKEQSQVFVVPTGPLTSFPLSVLVMEEPKGGTAGDADPQTLRDTPWLVKRHALTTLPSISSLKALRSYASKETGAEPFAGFGDPVLGPPTSVPATSRSVASIFRGTSPDPAALRTLDPLPATAGELKTLARDLGASEADVYLRERATEARIKTLDLSKKRVIAFATHGLMAGDLGLGEPGLVFTPPSTASETDDGYLAASEVASVNLRADWIILSACNTAAGDAPGAKGLSGLARAFFLAGSKSLLVSHWPVWDDAAMKLTTGAVHNMQKNPAEGRAEALRQSMLAVMNDQSASDFAHPAAWAPFVLVGETRAN